MGERRYRSYTNYNQACRMANKFRNISRVNNIYDTNKNINKKDQEDIMSLGNFCGKVLGVCLVYAIIVFQVSMATIRILILDSKQMLTIFRSCFGLGFQWMFLKDWSTAI
jgi:hypothetical protein